jgi:hypothetical protein
VFRRDRRLLSGDRIYRPCEKMGLAGNDRESLLEIIKYTGALKRLDAEGIYLCCGEKAGGRM